MESKSSVIQEVRKILDKNLKLRGLRKTPERYAIINEIKERKKTNTILP